MSLSRRFPRWGAVAAIVAVGAGVALATPAHAADRVLVVDARSDTTAATSTASAIAWRLPGDAAVGDVMSLDVGAAHAESVLVPETLIAASGHVLGDIVLGADGVLRVTLTSVGEAEADRRGSFVLTTRETEASTSTPGRTWQGNPEAALLPGERPGVEFKPADRTRANKWGQWIDDAETRIRWAVETPAGPWTRVTIADDARPGQIIDCAALTVRSTVSVDAETGYLVDLEPVEAGRLTTTCSSEELEIVVAAVEDGEIVEVSFEADAAAPELYGYPTQTVYRNIARVRAESGPTEESTRDRVSTLAQAVVPGSPEEPEEPGEPGEPETPTTPEEPTTPETPTTPDEPTTPENPITPDEPTTPPTPVLATTGAEASVPLSAAAAGILGAVGVLLLLLGRRAKGIA